MADLLVTNLFACYTAITLLLFIMVLLLKSISYEAALMP